MAKKPDFTIFVNHRELALGTFRIKLQKEGTEINSHILDTPHTKETMETLMMMCILHITESVTIQSMIKEMLDVQVIRGNLQRAKDIAEEARAEIAKNLNIQDSEDIPF